MHFVKVFLNETFQLRAIFFSSSLTLVAETHLKPSRGSTVELFAKIASFSF